MGFRGGGGAGFPFPGFGPASAPTQVGATEQDGTSGLAVRADHRHAFPAAAAGSGATTSTPGDTEADGTAVAGARADHRHARADAYASSVVAAAWAAAAAVGASANLARADHTHGLPNRPVFNVRDYGAVGDFATDDTTAFRNALAAAAAAGGGILFVPGGNYVLGTGVAGDILTSSVPVIVQGVVPGVGPGDAAHDYAHCSNLVINDATATLFHVTAAQGSVFRDFRVTSSAGARPHTGVGILLDAPGSSTQANSRIENVGFSQVGAPIKITRPAWPIIRGCYFDDWNPGGTGYAVDLRTTAGIEGSGGFITHNFFFGTSAMAGAPIYCEVGYTVVAQNEILGGSSAVAFVIKNNAAGFIKIIDNTIENFTAQGIYLASGDGSAVTQVFIERNEFESIAPNSPSAAINVDNSTTTPAYLTDLRVVGNTVRNRTATGGRHIWIGAGRNVVVSENLLDEQGANNPVGITVGGAATNAGLIAPFQILDNGFNGAFSARYSIFAANPAPVIRDLTGIAFAALPGANAGNGCLVYVTDGTALSHPLTGGGTGTVAVRNNGAWVSVP